MGINLLRGFAFLRATVTPPAAAASSLEVYGESCANRIMIGTKDERGIEFPLQPAMFTNRYVLWLLQSNTGSAAPGIGMLTPVATGTGTQRNVATTRRFTRMKRLGYVSSATAGSLCGPRHGASTITTGVNAGGSGTDYGGFFWVCGFGCSDAATVAGARQFVGITASSAAPTNVEPSTLINCIGVGHGAADTNLKIYYGGSAAQTPVDLGANFPANTLSTDAYQLTLYCPPGQSSYIHYKVLRVNTGHLATGTVNAVTAGVQLPANTTLLTWLNGWRSNNTTALAVELDFMGLYGECYT